MTSPPVGEVVVQENKVLLGGRRNAVGCGTFSLPRGHLEFDSIFNQKANNIYWSNLEENKLIGPNYADWLMNLRILLDSERRTYVLEGIPPVATPENTPTELATIEKWKDDDLKARCYILASMSNELQRLHQHMQHAAEIVLHIKALYGKQSRLEKYQVCKQLFNAHMTEGTSVVDHGLKMLNLIKSLEHLGVIMDNELYIDLILHSLPTSFNQFVINFNMHKMQTSLPELVNMLMTYEAALEMVLIGSAPSETQKSKKGKGRKPEKSKGLGPKGGVAKANGNKSGKCFCCGKNWSPEENL